MLTITITPNIFTTLTIHVLRNAGGGGGINFSGEKPYKGIRFNIISVYEGVGPISRKK